MKRLCLTLAMFAVFFAWQSSTASARSWSESVAEVLPRVFEFDEEGNRVRVLEEAMRYRYFLPAGYDPEVEYPLVLFLHGAGESGNDNQVQVSNNISSLIDQTESNYPAILVAPQLPTSSGWGHAFNTLDRTDEILDLMLSDFPVDTDRLYLTGLSMGGFGTMTYFHQYHVFEPGKLQFAAAAPVAGAWINVLAAEALRETPIWLAHGDRDRAVEPEFSRQTFNALAGNEIDDRIRFDMIGANGPMAESGNVRYTEYPGVGHDSWSRFYRGQDLYSWMFSQSSAVPEPTAAVIFLLGIALFASRRQ